MVEDVGSAALKRELGLKQAYATVFVSPDGRRVLADLLHYGGVLAVSEPGERDYAEGRRSMALHVLAKLRWTEAEFEFLARGKMPDPPPDQDQDEDA